jgi:FAD/FMN-containing dehydrogenase
MTSDLQVAIDKIRKLCNQPHSKSQLFDYGSYGYKNGVRRFLESSSDVARAVVEPGNIKDLSEIMKILAETKVSFGVSCGGHHTNPGFSSTKGIQISLSRLDKIEINKNDNLVVVGAGCLFDQVYHMLATHAPDRNVVGAVAHGGVGVSGWLLGGGYSSMKTTQYGLGIDNIYGVIVVLPSGEVINVTEGENDKRKQDLFWAVRGGGNNFGIVAEFTLKLHEQSPPYSHSLPYNYGKSVEVKKAIVDFVKNYKDKKACLEVFFRFYTVPGAANYQKEIIADCFYDGTIPTQNPFQKFLDISPDGPDSKRDPNTDYIRLETDFSIIRQHLLFDNLFGHVEVGILGEGEANDPGVFYNFKTSTATHSMGELKPMKGAGENACGRWGCVMLGKYTQKIIDEAEK